MPNVKFFLRSNNDLSTSHVLYCRVSYNNTTAEISMREKIDPKFWLQNQQKAKTPNKSQTKFINYIVESFTYRIKAMFLEKDYRHASARQILNEAFHKDEPEIKLAILIENYIVSQTDVKSNTIANHRIKQKNFLAFEKECKMNFVPSNFTPVYANRFIEWYKRTKETENNTSAVRTALFFKTVMQWALNQGVIEKFALSNFTAKKDKTKAPVYVNRNEFERLFMHTCENPYHDRIKDLFVFQCLTGLSYADLWSWKLDQKNEQTFIIGQRNKNGQEYRVPIDQLAKSILIKYNGRLPVYANIVYNRILKLVAQEVGIKKRLTTHVGRKTFATLMIGKGWSKESVALMLAHKSIKTTETYYIGLSFERIDTELEKINGKLSNSPQFSHSTTS